MKTYKGRTEAEQRAVNKLRKDAYIRKQELKAQGIEVEDSEDEILQVDTESIQPPTQQSFRDRMLAHFKSDPKSDEKPKPPVDKKRLEKSASLISDVLPLTFAGLLAVYSQRIIKEPYKVCAPTKQEVSTILLPIFSIISRHVEIDTKASQDVIDAGTSIIAALTVGTRIAISVMEVNNYVREQARSAEQSGNVTPFRGSSQTASNGTVQYPTSKDGTGTDGRQQQYDRNGNGSNSNGDDASGTSEAEQVHALMQRDRIGRARLGLAPFPV